MKTSKLILVVLFVCLYYNSFAQPTPPNGKKWQKIESLSDEFNGNSLNTAKWAVNVSTWKGRPPAFFLTENVSVKNGNLKLKATTLKNPFPVENSNSTFKTWTHGGALVRSLKRHSFGYYEAKMKANKTFMSSTFWLINKRNEFQGCDVRTTELDIVETVGANPQNKGWITNFISAMNSNTHSRGTTCNETPVGQKGNRADIGEESWRDYHTYGVWWKSKSELLFYLDGKHTGTVKPPADFNLPMYLRMVVETYDWNVSSPGKDGMNLSENERTTYYDWVRSYELVDDTNTTTDKVSFNNPPTSVPSQKDYTFNVNYEANTTREIVVEFWSSTKWLGSKKETVSKGKGTKKITLNLAESPVPGKGYLIKTHIRPVGTTWKESLDTDQHMNVTISASQLIPNGTYFIGSSLSNQRLLSRDLESNSARMHDPGNWKDQKWEFTHLGQNIYTIKNNGNGRYLGVTNTECQNGKNVITSTKASQNHQKWTIVPNQNFYNLKPVSCSNSALDISAGAINANVQIWQYQMNNANQKWSITTANTNKTSSKKESNVKNNIVSFFPNPTSDQLIIKGLGKKETIIIYDNNGTEYIRKKTTKKNETINTSGLKPGVYYLNVSDTFKTKIIKK